MDPASLADPANESSTPRPSADLSGPADNSRPPRAGSDPFGLRSVSVDQLRRKFGIKWRLNEPQYAAWVADMDFPIAPAVTDRLVNLVTKGELGYPPFAATPNASPAAMAFVERMHNRFGWSPDAGRLVEFNDVLQAVRAIVYHQSQAGDGVVVHMPAYHPFLDTLKDPGVSGPRRLVPVEWTADGFDYDDLERRLAVEPARIWILCHPHNPLGHVLDEAELARIADIAQRHDLLVISDEIHSDLVYAPYQHVPFEKAAENAAIDVRAVTVTSSSKAFNLAGLRWAIAHCRDTATFESLIGLPGHYLGAVNTLAVEATVAAWTEGSAWLDAVLAQLDENRHLVGALLNRHFPGATYRVPEATYLAWIDLRGFADGALGDSPAEVFQTGHIELSPGLQFGPSGVGHVRFNFATSPQIIEATFEAMAAVAATAT